MIAATLRGSSASAASKERSASLEESRVAGLAAALVEEVPDRGEQLRIVGFGGDGPLQLGELRLGVGRRRAAAGLCRGARRLVELVEGRPERGERDQGRQQRCGPLR